MIALYAFDAGIRISRIPPPPFVVVEVSGVVAHIQDVVVAALLLLFTTTGDLFFITNIKISEKTIYINL
jgi:hypothetical protein